MNLWSRPTKPRILTPGSDEPSPNPYDDRVILQQPLLLDYELHRSAATRDRYGQN